MRHRTCERTVAHFAVNLSPLDRARDLGIREDGLAVVVTSRVDGSAQVSVVNAGVLGHPVTGESVVAFVARGGTRKLVNLRVRARATVVFRSSWDWVAVEGDADSSAPTICSRDSIRPTSRGCCATSMPSRLAARVTIGSPLGGRVGLSRP